jgi:ATP dependent DNA ligase-like protein
LDRPLSIDRCRSCRALLPVLSDRRRGCHLRRGWHPGIRPPALRPPAQTSAALFAFDPLELGGKDMRNAPLEGRKRELAKLLRKAGWALRFNEHIDEPGDIVFRHACKLGLEGIVSKRKDSAYRSGRPPDWLKMKNADAPAVKWEAEEDWADEPFCCSSAPPQWL